MPNYATTIVKLFVRDPLSSMVPQIISALAAPGVASPTTLPDEADEAGENWIDFERLLPVPPEMREEGAHDQDAITVLQGRWPHGEDAPQGCKTLEDRVEAYRRLSPEKAAAVDRIRANISRWGVPSAYEWQVAKWGTKWNASAGPPRVDKTSEYDGYDDFPDSTMIHYRIVTAWSDPSGYLHALSSLCVRLGIGLRCWASYEDGGTEWDPEAEEYRTKWERLPDYDVEHEEMSSSDMLVLMGGGMEIEPDESAQTAVSQNDPLQLAMRALA